MVKTILISTNNPGKQAEICALLKDEHLILRTPEDLSLSLEVQETGDTYRENARIKAAAFCKASGLPSLADDSGLEVEALHGTPGLLSARYLRVPGATVSERRIQLIRDLEGNPRPWSARFVCTMALAMPDGKMHFSFGTCAGEIITEERGENGFGFDPIFLCKGTNRTMAELSMPEKNRISHRAKAAKGILPFLQIMNE
jgi:XTP/dITP diphosphohydrolase